MTKKVQILSNIGKKQSKTNFDFGKFRNLVVVVFNRIEMEFFPQLSS